MLSVAAAETAPLPVLKTVNEVRRLTTVEAGKAYPVQLRGVITYRAMGRTLMFLQDATGGVYVSPSHLAPPLHELGAGTEVELSGVTSPGRFAPFVEGRNGGAVEIKVLGQTPLPEPERINSDELGAPRFHSQWVEMGGVVRQVQQQTAPNSLQAEVTLTIGSSAGRFTAVIYGKEAGQPLSNNLVGAQVRLRGVYGSIFNDKRQLVGMRLFVSAWRDILVDRPGGEDPFTLPVQSIASLMQFDAARQAYHSRARVHGQVTMATGTGLCYMQDETGGLQVQALTPANLRPGDWVEVAGFPAWGEWNPVLEDAEVHYQWSNPMPEPAFITPAQALSGEYCFSRVRMEAMVLQSSRHAQQPVLVLKGDNKVFLARLANSSNAPPNYEEGSWLQITGICINQPDPVAKPTSPPWTDNLVKRPATFYLLAGSASDMTLLRPPPWWTVPKLLKMVALLVAVALAAGLWAFLLRRQVAAKTAIIQEQMAHAAVHEERERIARELHDTLEQEMTGIVMHLDAAGAMLEKSPEHTRRSLQTARALLDRSRSEARQSIWELRNTALEQGGLVAALEQLAQPAPAEARPRVQIQVEGVPCRLPAKVESHLLHIALEAATNAHKHSGASEVVIRLHFSPQEITLSVRDNGCGFDACSPVGLQNGRFGLLGMKERSGKIRGRLTLQSAPGQGTDVRITVPATLVEKPTS